MTHNLDETIIESFFRTYVSTKNQFKRFCKYQISLFKKLTGNDMLDWRYEDLSGDTPSDKAATLIELVNRTGHLANLIYHLIDWWINELKGDSSILVEKRMHNQVCIAGQILWERKGQRSIADIVFDHLGNIHESFGQEWQKAKRVAVLKRVPNLGPYKSVEELTALLKRCRELYETIGKLIKNHRLIDARKVLNKLDEILSGYGDESNEVACLKNEHEVCKLQIVIDAAKSGFVYDDQLPRETENPYRLFQELKTPITPGSSIAEVEEELQKLKKQKGGIPDETCAILETLVKNTSERLFVDAFLYPICPSEESVSSLIETYFQECHFPTPPAIKAKYPNDAAVLLFLLGKPKNAETIWKEALLEQPLDGLPAHCLGLFYLGLVYGRENTELEQRVSYWRSAIAHWAMVLANTVYWIKWARARCQNYKTPPIFAAVDTLISKIKSYLRGLLDTNDEADIHIREHREELKKQLDIEFETVCLSNALGGIDLGQGLSTWFGPLWMADYKLESTVAKHLAEFTPDPRMEYSLLGQLSPAEALRRLRWYFSYLSLPAILLEGPEPNPGETLKLLNPSGEYQGQDCGDAHCPVHGKNKYPVMVYCIKEDQFKAKNPAYKHQEKPMELMCKDALDLAIAAHSYLAKEQISDLELNNPEKLKDHWQNILVLANHYKNPKIVRKGLRSMVLEETNPIPKDMARIDAAITIIEGCLDVLSESYEKLNKEEQREESLKDIALKTRLAELLSNRGMKIFPHNLPDAEANLMRALDIAPHIPFIRIQLAMLWVNQAIRFTRQDRFLAQDYLRKAETLIEAGEEEYKDFDFSEIKGVIDQQKTRLALPKATPNIKGGAENSEPSMRTTKQPPTNGETPFKNKLYSQGIRELSEGRPDIALNTFDQALAAEPGDIEVQKEIPRALMEHAKRLTMENRHEEAVNLVKDWMGRLPTQKERMERQLEFLIGLPYIQPWLDAPKVFDCQVFDYQEFRLFFPDQSSRSELDYVRVQVEGNYLSLSALMPLFSDTEREKGLLNLLQATNNIMFKLAYSDKSELVLKSLVPFTLLNPIRLLNPLRLNDPSWFSQKAIDLFKFSGLSSNQILKSDTLRAQFREIEASSRQQHSNHLLPASTKAFIKFCDEQHLQYERMTDVYYKVNKGRIEVKAETNGIRFFMLLGQIPKSSNQKVISRKLVEYNTEIKQCKLALDDNMNVVFHIEWPYLDEQAVSETFALLEKYSTKLATQIIREQPGERNHA